MSPLLYPLAQAAESFGQAIALASPAGKMTYAQLDDAVARQVDWVRRAKLSPGHRVAIRAVPETELIVRLWAFIQSGVTVGLLNPQWPTEAIDQALHCMAVDKRVGGEADSANGMLIVGNELTPARAVPPIIASPATLVFSSGSTGAPKAIAHQLAAHLANAEGANRNLPLATGDSWLMSLPLYHVSGLGILFRCTLAGATVIIPAVGRSLAEQIAETRPTHLSLVPTQLIRLVEQCDRAPDCLRAVLLGGAPLPVELIGKACRAGWPLVTTYGLTEMASQVTATRLDASDDELRTAGHVLPHREVKITDDRQILVRGATLFEGYVQGHIIDCPTDSDGWFATGDLGSWDSRGRLIITGRRDNLFISGGENIYPEEIELVLLDLHGVFQAVVVPVADPVFGQRPLAFVDGDLDRVEFCRASLRERLPRYKIPDRFLAWPKTTGLKPDRRELQRLASSIAQADTQ